MSSSGDRVTSSQAGAFVFAGGGSGGHIYPGFAIAGQLRRLSPAIGDILFIVSDRAIDAQVMSGSSERWMTSPAKPVSVRPRGLIRFLANWGTSVRQTRQHLRELKEAHGRVQLIAMGGFVAAPAVQAAIAERVPITMVNLDAVPGKANRWMAGRINPPKHGRVFTAARVHGNAPGWTEVAPIVRAGARATADRAECRRRLGLDPDRPVLMITGGSQGIRTINGFALAFAGSAEGRAALHAGRWQILHQTGRNEDEPARQAYASAGFSDARVQAFVDTMGLWWGAADLCLCTAGAGNVAEIWSSKAPAILMPYPYHKDQHQKFNALALESCGGCIVATDHIDRQKNLEHIGPLLLSLLNDHTKRDAMCRALETLGPADGAERIAQALLDR
jgi:UDP-N-acetylglucosamine--N-acetylmuramyl-(pentapeptide) pyrophosphoryl-undecaprenol N-acetylglucosamine transferase